MVTTLDLSSNNLGGQSSYIKKSKLSGETFKLGDRVLWMGREVVVSVEEDSDGDLKVSDLSGITALASALTFNAKVKSLNLLHNSLDVPTAQKLGEILKGHPSLTTLCGIEQGASSMDLRAVTTGVYLQPVDGVLLACDLAVNAVVTTLNLGGNQLCGLYSDGSGTYSLVEKAGDMVYPRNVAY